MRLRKERTGTPLSSRCFAAFWQVVQTALWADNTSGLYEEELRIYKRIRRGDFGRDPFSEGTSWPLAAAARAFYQEAAEQLNRRPLYAGVYLTDPDHRALLQHLAGRYREYASYQAAGGAPLRAAA